VSVKYKTEGLSPKWLTKDSSAGDYKQGIRLIYFHTLLLPNKCSENTQGMEFISQKFGASLGGCPDGIPAQKGGKGKQVRNGQSNGQSNEC
jgi:hypothetical protein